MDVKEELKDKKYTEAYSEGKLFKKIIKFAKAAGIKVIYLALLLFYTLAKPTTPFWAKAKIIGALGYFITPLDFIPDLIPGVGYTDDLGALVYAFGAVAMHVDEESKQKAKERLHVWFADYDESELASIDKKIDN